MKVNMRCFLIVFWLCVTINIYAQEETWMPDPTLREAVRETLDIPAHLPLTPEHLQSLIELDVREKGIATLTGLEHATSLETLFAGKNSIRVILPLTNLTSMWFLSLNENQISDITPLTGMKSLHTLKLGHNQIVNITPLSSLRELRHLELHYNRITDFSPLAGLMNLEAIYTWGNVSVDLSMVNTSKIPDLNIDWECDIQRSSADTHIFNRDYPSLVSSWGGVEIPTLSEAENIPYHDLHFCCPNDLNLHWRTTTQGLKLIGDFEDAKRKLDELLSLNPNLVILVPVLYYSGVPWDHEVRWQYSIPNDIFLRDEKGDSVIDEWDDKILDFTLPQTQQFVRDQVLALSKCGLFDGIFLDHWDYGRRLREYRTLEEEHAARDAILQSIREIDENFLILVNANQQKIPRSAPYINGLFMETRNGEDGTYDDAEIAEIQETLLWAETAVREPRINCLWGFGSVWEPPNSPQNWQFMRFFTTMSLTHSDGYVMFQLASYHVEILQKITPPYVGVYPIWSDFWDAPLGRPIGQKGQLYKNREGHSIEGLFIREFTNGWAVYNRSGKTQSIQLREKTKGVASGFTGVEHTLPDLDGEICLKVTAPPTDVNGDGVVNVLDLVVVANAFE